jgi:ABC-type molybdate transport system substrate-binding protein
MCLALVAFAPSASAEGTVNVLYAGSLVNLMERTIGPAFTKTSGDQFRGYAGGSNKIANEIKGGLRRGDIFISANPKVDDQLMGAAKRRLGPLVHPIRRVSARHRLQPVQPLRSGVYVEALV